MELPPGATDAFEQQACVGLFGTCGESTFRHDLFIPEYERLGIPYFNPQVAPGTWRPELADVEADHLAYDTVQCWPVLGSTYGTGSLAEQGYSIASSLRAPSPLPKAVIAMVEMELDECLDDDIARAESLRARRLAVAHMAKSESPNLYVVGSLEEMLEASVTLYQASEVLVHNARAYNPALRRFVQGRQERLAFAQALASGHLGQNALKLARQQEDA